MIKENVLNRNRKCTDFTLIDFRKYAENGFLTDEGITYYQDKMMMENNHNLLFGEKGDVPVGLCEDRDIVGRSLNNLVIGGSETTASYLFPNLFSIRSSAVIAGTSVDYDKYIHLFEDNGIKVKVFDFSDVKARFDPFRHFIKREKKDASGEIDKKFLSEQAAAIGRKFAYCFCKTEDKTLEAAYRELAERIFSYIAVSPDLKDEERRSSKVFEVVFNAVSKKDMSVFEEYKKTDCLEQLSAVQLSDVLNTFIQAATLFLAKAFSEKDDTDNISIEEIVNDKTYLFLDVKTNENLLSFMVSVLSEFLYNYAETDLAHPKRIYQFLPNPVQFYLDLSYYDIPDFLYYITTCAPYGIGYSIITSRVDVIERIYEAKAETIYSYMDSLVIYKISDLYGLASEMFFRWFIPFKETDPEKNPEFKNWTALSKKALDDNKVLVRIRDVPCIICDRLKLKDFIEETMPEEVS